MKPALAGTAEPVDDDGRVLERGDVVEQDVEALKVLDLRPPEALADGDGLRAGAGEGLGLEVEDVGVGLVGPSGLRRPR
ncbi:hypothetical protein V2J63_04690 [Georgenia sp. MJ278]